MSLSDWIAHALEERLQPTRLSVLDESHQHIGHGGWREGGQTLTALIEDMLAGAFERGLHALAIQAKAPGE